MNNGVQYKGICSYNKKKYTNFKIFVPSMFVLVTTISTLVFGNIFHKIYIQHKNLSENNITQYQDVVGNVSKNRAEINWQEVAAINEIINDGKKDDVLENIASNFLEKTDGEQYRVITIDEVMKKLNLTSDEIQKVNDYLNNVVGANLYKEAINDPEKIAFIENIKEPAMESFETYGVLPSITMAQAILESAWGTSELATEHKNLFGIKADGRWSGAVATITTKENYDDVIEANFRKYDSILQSIEDHGEFLAKNARYKDNGVFSAKDYKAQAQALENAGYSTAKDESGEKIYADKLIEVVQKYNLMVFDTEAIKGK